MQGPTTASVSRHPPSHAHSRRYQALGIVVHGLKAGRDGVPPDSAIDFYRSRVEPSKAPVAPKIVCRPTHWLHSHSAGWRHCWNNAPCGEGPGDERGELMIPKMVAGKATNETIPWFPVWVRGLCAERRAAVT